MPPETGARTLELLERAHAYNRWIFERVAASLGSRVLEIGCGTGTFTQFLVDRSLVVGIDVEEDYVRIAQDRYRNRPNVTVRRVDLTQSVDGLAAYRFDSVVSINVFEHIEDDLAAMRAAHAVLVPGGSLTLLVPSHPRLMSPFDRAIGHHRRYTKAEMREKLEAAQFRVEQLRHTNPVGAAGWLINNVALRQPKLRGLYVYNRLVPLLAGLDRHVELPFGLSLVAVGRKPA